MIPAHHGANGSGFYHRHRSSGTQTKGAYLIYGLLVMFPALGLVEFVGGSKWEVLGDTMRFSVIVFIFVAIAAGGRPCLALSIPSAPQ